MNQPCNILLGFGFLQIHMLHDDISRIQLELVPMIQEIITEWHIIHFLGTTTSESSAAEDFSSQLSSLQLGKSKALFSVAELC